MKSKWMKQFEWWCHIIHGDKKLNILCGLILNSNYLFHSQQINVSDANWLQVFLLNSRRRVVEKSPIQPVFDAIDLIASSFEFSF